LAVSLGVHLSPHLSLSLQEAKQEIKTKESELTGPDEEEGLMQTKQSAEKKDQVA